MYNESKVNLVQVDYLMTMLNIAEDDGADTMLFDTAPPDTPHNITPQPTRSAHTHATTHPTHLHRTTPPIVAIRMGTSGVKQ